MARITVEDCLKKIPNRFELVLAAAYRARLIAQGHQPHVDAKDKPAVVALREIANGDVGRDEMLERVVWSFLLTVRRCSTEKRKAP